jgi:hypothetical protein
MMTGIIGFGSVPTIVVRTNDPAAVKALRLALNRVAEDAGWNREVVREELKFLVEVDYQLDLTGFRCARDRRDPRDRDADDRRRRS